MIRPYDGVSDCALVLDSWCRQVRACSPCRVMAPEAWDHHRAMLEWLAPHTLVEHEPGWPAQVHGWACGWTDGGLPVLHMVYTRSVWRRQGTATRLLTALFGWPPGERPLHITHRTRQLPHYADRWRLVYNPYMVVRR